MRAADGELGAAEAEGAGRRLQRALQRGALAARTSGSAAAAVLSCGVRGGNTAPPPSTASACAGAPTKRAAPRGGGRRSGRGRRRRRDDVQGARRRERRAEAGAAADALSARPPAAAAHARAARPAAAARGGARRRRRGRGRRPARASWRCPAARSTSDGAASAPNTPPHAHTPLGVSAAQKASPRPICVAPRRRARPPASARAAARRPTRTC